MPYSPSIKRLLEIERISLIKILIQTLDNLTASSHGFSQLENTKIYSVLNQQAFNEFWNDTTHPEKNPQICLSKQ